MRFAAANLGPLAAGVVLRGANSRMPGVLRLFAPSGGVIDVSILDRRIRSVIADGGFEVVLAQGDSTRRTRLDRRGNLVDLPLVTGP